MFLCFLLFVSVLCVFSSFLGLSFFFFLTLLTSRLLKTCIFDLSKSNIWLFSPLCGCLNSVYFHLTSLSWCYFNSVSFILYIIIVFKERVLDHVDLGCGTWDLLQQVGSGCLHVDFPPGVACSLTGFSEWSYLSHGTWDLS